jgi:hypothetical protein
MGEACGTYGGEERYMHRGLEEKAEGKTKLEKPGVDARISLK